MIKFSRKKRLKVCHAYRVNRWKELVETLHVDGLIIVGVPFVILNESGKRPQRYDTTQTVSKLRNRICDYNFCPIIPQPFRAVS